MWVRLVPDVSTDGRTTAASGSCVQRSRCRPNQTRTRPWVTTVRPIFRRQRTQVAHAIGYRAGWDIAHRGDRGCDAFDMASAHSHAKRTCGWASSAEFDDTCRCASSVEACGTACDADGRRGARLFALHRRGVRDCRRCGDEDLRRRHHGRRRADGRCLDVSVATSRSMLRLVSTGWLKFTLQPGVLYTDV
jgi:hypothetical protein